MMNAASLEIYEYWSKLRANRSAPCRTEIDPSQIRSILPDLFMLKEEEATGLGFGLTGTRLFNLFQTELSGTSFTSIWHNCVADYAASIANGVMDHELPAIFDIKGETSNGVENVALEMVLLPLATEQDQPRRLLGCISCEPARGDFSRPLSPLSIVRSNLLQPPEVHEADTPSQPTTHGRCRNMELCE